MASGHQQTFDSAVAAWQLKDYAKVCELLAHASDGQSLHLRGLASRRLGDLDTAKVCLESAARLDPANPEIRHNLALLEIDFGRHAQAYDQTTAVLALKPDWHTALRTRGRILIALGRWADALHVYEKVLLENPDDQAACFGRANAWLEQGQAEQAEAEFYRLIESGMSDPACLFMRARARQVLGQMQRARADFEQAMLLQPSAIFLREAARHLWTMGEHDAFHALLSKPYSDPAVQLCAGELLRQSGNFKQLTRTLLGAENSPDALAILAWSELDQNQPREALRYAERAVQLHANHPNACAALITSLCGLGHPARAQQHVDRMRVIYPNAQHWIAYQLTIWRLLGDVRYREWMDYNKLVQTFEVAAPPGYTSIEAFNEEFETALLELHNLRCHPIDQSLRGGSQTRQDLQFEQHPVIKSYLAALDQPIQEYLEHIGQGKDHPLSQRNTGEYKFAGCWSVKLNGGGHHINHVHPEGWISSAYYISVPARDAERKSGWIKFGEPAYPTEPASNAEYWVEPVAGRLVLFPSYLWHGTNPTRGDELRLTAPFDIVPN